MTNTVQPPSDIPESDTIDSLDSIRKQTSDIGRQTTEQRLRTERIARKRQQIESALERYLRDLFSQPIPQEFRATDAGKMKQIPITVSGLSQIVPGLALRAKDGIIASVKFVVAAVKVTQPGVPSQYVCLDDTTPDDVVDQVYATGLTFGVVLSVANGIRFFPINDLAELIFLASDAHVYKEGTTLRNSDYMIAPY